MMMAVLVVVAVGPVDVHVIMAMVVPAIGPMHMRFGMARRGRCCFLVGHGFHLLPSTVLVSSGWTLLPVRALGGSPSILHGPS